MPDAGRRGSPVPSRDRLNQVSFPELQWAYHRLAAAVSLQAQQWPGLRNRPGHFHPSGKAGPWISRVCVIEYWRHDVANRPDRPRRTARKPRCSRWRRATIVARTRLRAIGSRELNRSKRPSRGLSSLMSIRRLSPSTVRINSIPDAAASQAGFPVADISNLSGKKLLTSSRCFGTR